MVRVHFIIYMATVSSSYLTTEATSARSVHAYKCISHVSRLGYGCRTYRNSGGLRISGDVVQAGGEKNINPNLFGHVRWVPAVGVSGIKKRCQKASYSYFLRLKSRDSSIMEPREVTEWTAFSLELCSHLFYSSPAAPAPVLILF